jgi:hypothetical protein
VCEPTNFCSFGDNSCSAGRRYGEHAGAYSGRCVGEALDDGGVDTPIAGGYSIGGSVTGLGTGTMKLQNNGIDTVEIASNGPFMFPTRLPTGASYSVTVMSAPTQQSVWLTRAAGTVASGPVANIGAWCYAAGTDPGIFCGNQWCPISTTKCCHDRIGPGGVCAALATVCGTYMDASCDSAVDCSGKVCCAHIATSDGALTAPVTCVNTLSSCSAGAGEAVLVLCDPNAATPCPSGGTCKSDPFSGWWHCS